MNKYFFNIILGVKTLVLGALIACFVAACSSDSPKQKDENVVSSTYYEVGPNSLGTLITLRHDGHLFVLEARHNKGAILHHPDCPCKK